MVICKFFLQGTCKFGNTCRFEHQINDTTQGSSILRQANQNAAPGAAMDPNTLVRFVVSDMTSAEQGKQWIFSSYSPFKDKPAFPGFEDKSFEEVRLGFYEATQNGTVEPYKQMVQMLYQETLAKIKVLQNPNEEIVKVLTQIYNTPVANQNSVFQPNAGSNVFNSGGGTQNSPSVFGGSNPQGNSIFGGVVQNNNSNNVFGQKSMFGNNVPNASPFLNNQSIFGNNNNNMATNTNNNVFGQSNNVNPTNNIFGHNNNNNPPNTNIFAKTPFPQNNIFGNNILFNNKQNQPQPPFGTQNGPFGNPTNQPGPFTNPSAQPSPFSVPISQPSPFGNTPTQPGGPFVNNANNNNQNTAAPIFGNTQAPNGQNPTILFQPNPNIIFGGQQPALNNNPAANTGQQNPAVSQPSQSVFAQNPIFGNSILNVPAKIFGAPGMQKIEGKEDGWYSKLEDLSAEEVKSFESEQFEFGKIPENPPTLQMCF